MKLVLELWQQILQHLPLDAKLVTVSFASKTDLAPSVFQSVAFARMHWKFQHSLHSTLNVWQFLDVAAIKDSTWASLPINYKIAIYRDLLSADPAKTSLMGPLRWPITTKQSLAIFNNLLADSSFNPSCQNNRPIRWAVATNSVAAVSMLLTKPSVDPCTCESSPIAIAAQSGYLEVLNLLLIDSRADPTSRKGFALMSSSEKGNVDVVKRLLLEPRVDPNADEGRAIRLASLNGHLEVVRLLLEDGRCDPSGKMNNAIRAASSNGHVEVVRTLMADPRVNPSAGDYQHGEPLYYASMGGHVEAVRLLLQDVRVDPTVFNNRALNQAIANKHFSVARLLLSHSAYA